MGNEPVRVLIISPHFPPSTLAGVHRARHLAKHLPVHGWTPVVIRVDERHYTEAHDHALAELVPKSVEQVRVPAIPAGAARIAGISDIGLRGYFQIKQTIVRQIAKARPDTILITGSPYYPMLLAEWIKRNFDIPVVLDFQDPWVSAAGAMRPRWSKGGIAHRLALLLEPRAVRHAAFITSVSEIQNAEMARRYVWLDESRMSAIPIGGDPEDFVALRARPLERPRVILRSDCINFSYVGTALPRSRPLFRALFKALRLLRDEQPRLAEGLMLNFIGTSNQPNGTGKYQVLSLAREEGVGDLVLEIPERITYLDALHVLTTSDGLLLIGSDEPHYTASKIYPSLMSGRPYLSLFHSASSAHEILSSAGGGDAISFVAVSELKGLIVTIADSLRRLSERPSPFLPARVDAYMHYTASAVAADFARVFDRLIR